MKRLHKVSVSLLTSFLSLAMLSAPNSYAAIEDYSEEDLAQIKADMDTYDEEINTYGDEFGYTTDRFYFPNISYHARGNNTDINWQSFRKRSTNVQAAFISEEKYGGSTGSGLCLGISIASILAHNGVFSPSDIQGRQGNAS